MSNAETRRLMIAAVHRGSLNGPKDAGKNESFGNAEDIFTHSLRPHRVAKIVIYG
ncbi:MAG: hypothetical protein ACYS18_07155 [Planctomycetota bacterium]|jgi:hypothetical protein